MTSDVAEDEDATMRMLSLNLPSNIFRNPDPRIQMAAQESERTKQILPVLKEELRLRILTKRMERGEPELETAHSPKTYELTEEEVEKRERRKEQNRVAARKCREKRKMKNLDQAEKYDNAREKKEALELEIQDLEKKARLVEQFCNQHILSGCCRMTSMLPSTPVSLCHHNNNNNSSSSSCGTFSNTSTAGCCDINDISDSIHTNNISSNGSNSNEPCSSSSSSSRRRNSNTSSSTPAVIVSSQAHPISPLTPLSPNSPIQSLPPTSPNSISPDLLSPSFGHHTPVDASGQSNVWLTSLNSGIQTPPTFRSTSPKSSGSSSAIPRHHVSRASSTASLPPPHSPCHANHCSSSLTLTPPPSVSSEFNIVPESPSYFTNLSGFDHLGSDHLMADMDLSHYATQLSPQESIANGSPNINMIVHQDKMFDDDDDDDENDQKDISAMVPWDKLQ